MTQAARDFLTEWLRKNISADAPADKTRAREMADQCRAEAQAVGISDDDLDPAVDALFGGNLEELIADTVEAAIDVDALRRTDQPDDA